MTIDNLLEVIKSYNPEEVDIIRRAYEYADTLHKGQYRQSGEPYITHPLNVAYILAEMHADRDTVCAGLLHDTIEDTDTTKEDIAEVFEQTNCDAALAASLFHFGEATVDEVKEICAARHIPVRRNK